MSCWVRAPVAPQAPGAPLELPSPGNTQARIRPLSAGVRDRDGVLPGWYACGMTLEDLIAAARELSEEERQLLLKELQDEPFVPTPEQQRDIDCALAAAHEGRLVPESEIRAMLHRK